MRNGICTEFDVGAGYGQKTGETVGGRGKTHFFMMMYLRAFPRVWLSLRNSKEAAVGVEPGS